MSRVFYQITIILLMGMTLIVNLSCSRMMTKSTPANTRSLQSRQSIDAFLAKRDKGLERIQLPTDQLRSQTMTESHRMERLEPGEICVINADLAEAETVDEFVRERGYATKKRRVLETFGVVMSILQAPSERPVAQGIRELREAFPTHIVDANHYYDLQEVKREIDPRRYAQQRVGWTERTTSCVDKNIRVGMVDTAIMTSSMMLQNQSIRTESFLADGSLEAISSHGTAIATLLIGQGAPIDQGLMPQVTLFAAEAFRQGERGSVEASTWNIVRALDWLVQQRVHVINLSLGGPYNALLSYAIDQTLSHNIPVVTAAGNAGPHGQMMYPAAEDGVVAVTAVDPALQPYAHANRGSYIAFSAPGVDIWIPMGNGNGIFKSGTSFATPFVTTAAVILKQHAPQSTPEHITALLADESLDLGVKGKDDVFGWGLIQLPHQCETAASSGSGRKTRRLSESAINSIH